MVDPSSSPKRICRTSLILLNSLTSTLSPFPRVVVCIRSFFLTLILPLPHFSFLTELFLLRGRPKHPSSRKYIYTPTDICTCARVCTCLCLACVQSSRTQMAVERVSSRCWLHMHPPQDHRILLSNIATCSRRQ